MGVKQRGPRNRARTREVESASNISTFGSGVRISRAALLAGASLIALAALGAPGTALACTGADQTISTVVSGPIFSTGGTITVLGSGTIDGAPTGVAALSCAITTLTNSGAIDGGLGGPRIEGGVGVLTAAGVTIGTLTNAAGATISGGSGGTSAPGGAGVSNAGAITKLTNGGMIRGGS